MIALKPTGSTWRDAGDCDGTNRAQLIEPRHVTSDGVASLLRQRAAARMLRVLIVDDDHDTADVLDMLVRHWGHQSCRTYSGLAAMVLASEMCPDVVLLDVEMPLLGGCALAAQLRKTFSRDECLIIAITGRADEERRLACNAAGIDLVLLKPVDPSVIETLLMLEGSRVNGVAITGEAFVNALQKN